MTHVRQPPLPCRGVLAVNAVLAPFGGRVDGSVSAIGAERGSSIAGSRPRGNSCCQGALLGKPPGTASSDPASYRKKSP